MGALTVAGYHDVAYFGVPDGFALVTRIEQTDGHGAPLSDEARWSIAIVAMKSFSIEEYIRALLTSPVGYFRVIVLVTSSKPFNFSGARARLETIEQWSRSGLNSLPDAVRKRIYTEEHQTTALVYEFEKKTTVDTPEVYIPGRLTAREHLANTELKEYVR